MLKVCYNCIDKLFIKAVVSFEVAAFLTLITKKL